MDTILFFSLIFVGHDVSQKELKGSSYHTEQFPELFPRNMRNTKVLLLQEAQGGAQREALGQNQMVATLQCCGSGSQVTVNLQDWEKRPKAWYSLQSLSVMTAPLRDSLPGPRCCLSTVPQLWSPTGLHVTVQVFLPNISNCKFGPMVEAPLERLSTTTIITPITEDREEEESSITDIGEDLLLRKRWSIVVKALIAVTLLISGMVIIIFVIFEVPCSRSCPGAGHLCHCQQWGRLKEDSVQEGPLPEVGLSRTEDPNSSSPKNLSEIIIIHQTYF
ncbi:LOW QUALITY PROTEIN: uncharacterized protein C17orf78 homolog [Sarcophilus harrisii]|uniref:LOW QUALITY PROTEIN: uncharacterized protein C17orf78 homolog n=1 Tax=Sarcophilus harrisii TaxID=9305 RepID=UPI000C7BF4DB|nr:LOW QUALITY PROTEIN: uncharacterized protein C17orf78 homolog [Sarcophilus harrisii]